MKRYRGKLPKRKRRMHMIESIGADLDTARGIFLIVRTYHTSVKKEHCLNLATYWKDRLKGVSPK